MIVLVIAVLIGLIPAMVASSKGRDFVLWWLYGAALFIIALPHALLLPANTRLVERRMLDDGTNRRCPHCAEVIKREALVCRYCGRDMPGPAGPNYASPDSAPRFDEFGKRI